MANLKKLLAGAMALCMAGAMFASCKGGESGSKKQEKGSDASANTIRIYTWNDEFKSRLRNYYPEYDKDKSGFSVDADGNEVVGEHEYLKDGKEIVWVTRSRRPQRSKRLATMPSARTTT